MKKLLNILFISIFTYTLATSCYAYSNTFDYMLSVMDVNIENIHGLKINEDVYNKYSLFVYGSPEEMHQGQRWKDVENGLWNNGKAQGEYWILGENYNGYEVHNHKFPADIEPPTTPEQWRYALISNAQSSWQDQSKYMDDFQRDYMLNTKLMRNEVTYNITALDIGLDKVRLENYATWKTKGSVYTERYDKDNKRWAANFMTMPMSADSKINSFAEFQDGEDYFVPSGDSSISIPITFGAEATDLSEFARKEHVKEIKSEIYINDLLIDSVSGSERLYVSKEIEYSVLKPIESNILTLNIEIKSHLTTKFTTDGALVDIKYYTLTIYFGVEKEENIEEEEELPEDDYIEPRTYYNGVLDINRADNELVPPPVIESIKVHRIKNGNDVELLKLKNSTQKFVCAGETISVEVVISNNVSFVEMSFNGDSSIFTFDTVTKKVEWDEPRARNKSTFKSTLKEFEQMYQGSVRMKKISSTDTTSTFYYSYIIPSETKQTLNSWNTLRQKAGDAFKINDNQLFTRIRSPYEIVIYAKGFGGEATKRTSLDVFERWDTIYNRDISQYVSNLD